MVKRARAPAAEPELLADRRHRRPARRRDRARGPDPHLQRDAARRQRQAHARAASSARAASASASPRAPARSSTDDAHHGADAPPARLKARYLEEIRPQLIERFGYSSVMQAPRSGEDHAEHGRRPRQAGLESAQGGDRAARDDRRPAAERAPRAQVDRRVQTARGHAGRRGGDAARRARLRVPRPARSRSRSRESATSVG